MKLYCSSSILLVVCSVCILQISATKAQSFGSNRVPIGLRDKISEDELNHVLEIQKDIVAAHPDFANDNQLSINDIKKGLSIFLVKEEIVSPDVETEEFNAICKQLIVEPCKKVATALDSSSAGALAFRLSFCRLIAQDESNFCPSTLKIVAGTPLNKSFGRN